MSSGGFGPAGPGVEDAPPFAVAGPSEVAVDASRSGSGSFTLSNLTARAVRARVFVNPGPGAEAAWFGVAEPERALPEAGTVTVDVAVTVPAEAPAGSFSFSLGAALEESPDRVVSGSTVAFTVPEAAKRPFPWWIVIVAAVAVLVLGLGALAIWWFTRPGDPETPSTTDPSIVSEGSFTFEGGPIDVDLDTGTVTAGIRDGADLSMSDADALAVPSDRPLLVFVYTGGVGVVDEGDFSTCQAATLSDDVEVPDGVETTHLCVFTSDGRIATMAITGVPGDPVLRDVTFTVWE